MSKKNERLATVRFYVVRRSDNFAWNEDPHELITRAVPNHGQRGLDLPLGTDPFLIETGAVDDPITTIMVSHLREELLVALAEDGITGDLVLDENQDLAFRTHVGLLPGGGEQRRVVAMIRSATTPGYLQVRALLAEATQAPELLLVPLRTVDPAELVRQSDGVTSVKIRMADDQVNIENVISESFGLAAQTLRSLTDTGTVEVRISVQKSGRARWRSWAIALAERIAGESGEVPAVEAEVISGTLRQIVGLKVDEITRRVSVSVPDDEPRTLSPTTAASQMAQAYNEMITPISSSLAALEDQNDGP